MKPFQRHGKVLGGSAGFTLFEILVALFILSLIFSVLFTTYTGTLKMTQDWDSTGKVFSMARGAMDRMMKDLESAYAGKQACPFVMEQDMIGDKPFPRLSFYTTSRVHTESAVNPPAEGISLVTYSVRLISGSGDYELTRSASPDGVSGSSDFVICRGLSSLRYRFYDRDGKEITGPLCSAGSKNPPASVVLELSMANQREESKPFHFMTRVCPVNFFRQDFPT